MTAAALSLAAVVTPDRVFARLKAPDKARLLGDLARRASVALGLPVATLTAALAAREALGSTGVGGGIAVPHARLADIAAPTGFFARLDRPLDYAAIDGRPVDLVFLLLSPALGGGASDPHLMALSAVSRRLRDPAVAAALRAAPDVAALHTLLTRPAG